MTGLLGIIMNANNLFDFGVCNFNDIADYLINCDIEKELPLNAESVICVVFPCKTTAVGANPNEVFNLRRAASHMLQMTSDALSKAFGEYEFVWYLDNSPIPEVMAAAKSGLGIVGDSGLLITPEYGSFCFTGSIVTNLQIPETGKEIGYCEHCKKCIEMCPAKALSEKSGFDKGKCVKYASKVNYENNAFLLRQGTAVRGCNLCREVCPYNQNIKLADAHPFIQAAMHLQSICDSDGVYKPMDGIGKEKFKPFPGE